MCRCVRKTTSISSRETPMRPSASGSSPSCSAVQSHSPGGPTPCRRGRSRLPSGRGSWCTAAASSRPRRARDRALGTAPRCLPAPPGTRPRTRRSTRRRREPAGARSRRLARHAAPSLVVAPPGVRKPGSDPGHVSERHGRARPERTGVERLSHIRRTYQRTRGGAGLPWASCHETTGLRRTPIRSISASITSPGRR